MQGVKDANLPYLRTRHSSLGVGRSADHDPQQVFLSDSYHLVGQHGFGILPAAGVDYVPLAELPPRGIGKFGFFLSPGAEIDDVPIAGGTLDHSSTLIASSAGFIGIFRLQSSHSRKLPTWSVDEG
jgi:hypothetical protein